MPKIKWPIVIGLFVVLAASSTTWHSVLGSAGLATIVWGLITWAEEARHV